MSDDIRSKFEHGLLRANEFLADIGIFCLVSLTLLISANVLMRYFLNAPISWADEFSAYLLLGIIFFGLAYALQDGAHIKIDFVVAMLPKKLQFFLSLAVHGVGVFFATLLLLGAYSRVNSFWELNTQSMGEFEFPLYVPALMLIIGCGMFLLVMMTRTAQLLVELFETD
jgi:TRAP-type C4-dicarboxylate transport system permease small subunit